ncbi:hypothetical protein LPJ63_001084 [Coemansia sp. RSA 2711]|nr:hypothetical protein LPJ63_001084 [Coemansia sp. RSA 2711]KAJ2320995.1 hypothetical protein IWW52_001024 [Coemansia sp. RSA 2704]KAJ2738668.1 hypothetical protein H4R23_000989 [Coemansia sp. Cherry 401B]
MSHHCQSEATEHDHSHDHGHDHSHEHDADADTGLQDSLFSQVDSERAWCLNESEPNAIKAVFKPWHQRLDTTLVCQSDADEELLIHVPFTSMVKLKSLFIWGGSGEAAPRTLRVFANRDDLDFDNVGDAEPTQTLELIDNAGQPPEYPVRTAKFGSTRSLTLHVPDNYGAEQTSVYYLAFRGEWTELSETPVISVYELKPNAADHKTPNENLSHHSIS